VQHYERGYQEAIDGVLHHLLRHSPPGSNEQWRLERNAAVAMLRQVCDEHGDNAWLDRLNLADVIEKHLWRHLEAKGSTP
jgi:predicted secreted protein